MHWGKTEVIKQRPESKDLRETYEVPTPKEESLFDKIWKKEKRDVSAPPPGRDIKSRLLEFLP